MTLKEMGVHMQRALMPGSKLSLQASRGEPDPTVGFLSATVVDSLNSYTTKPQQAFNFPHPVFFKSSLFQLMVSKRVFFIVR